MDNKKIILPLFIGLMSAIIGFFGGQMYGCKKHCTETCGGEKRMCKQKHNDSLGDQPSQQDVFFSSIDPSEKPTVEKALEISHNFSVAFRRDTTVGYCTLDKDGKVNVDPNRLGFFDISYDNILDLLLLSGSLRNSKYMPEKPDNFRIINGIDGGKSILMVVGLTKDKKEIVGEAGDTNPFIFRLDNPNDCPIKCDYVNSIIITRGNNTKIDPCN